MALAHVEQLPEPEDFTRSVARNIRALLAMRDMHGQDLAAHIGMSPQMFSQRMSGRSRWLAMDLDRIARAFQVDADVLFAADEQEFREALTRSRCSAALTLLDGGVPDSAPTQPVLSGWNELSLV